MKQPVSTISNIVYAIAGFYLLGESQLVGWSLVGLAIGSAAYHATGTRWGARLDEIGMYAVLSAILAHAVGTLALDLTGVRVDAWIPFAVILAPLTALSGKLNSYRLEWPFGVLPWLGGLVAVGVGYNLSFTYPVTVAVLTSGGVILLFLVALAFRQFGEQFSGHLPRAEDWIHGTLWHPLTAYGLYLAAVLTLT